MRYQITLNVTPLRRCVKDRLIVIVPESRVCELWLETETNVEFLARQGAHGLDRMGWHNHHGQITGDWYDEEEVVNAYHLNTIH